MLASDTTLHWCLQSIASVTNQIVIVDTGITDEGRRIARQYDVEVVQGPDPQKHGFSAARNFGIEHAHGDWILSIDTDERLVNAANLGYYLRQNIFDGYTIKQCNFHCEDEGVHETPVRLFRNNRARNDGKKARFFGYVHETFETAINEGAGAVAEIPDVFLAHVGYLGNEITAQKFQRNAALLELDRRDYPHRIIGSAVKLRDNAQISAVLVRQHGGTIIAVARRLCEESIDIFSSTFLENDLSGKGLEKVCLESLQHYSSALALLGKGFEFNWEIPRTEGKASSQRFQGRFQSMKEVEAAIGWTMSIAKDLRLSLVRQEDIRWSSQ